MPDSAGGFLALGNERLFGVVPLPVLLMAAAFAASWVLLHQTRFGQHLYAIGGNREAARLVGIPLARHETAVYVLCSLFAGLSGLIHASQLYAAEPGSGQGFELNAIAAVVVGGTSFTGGIGSVPGTLLGAVIIGILDKGLNQAGVHFSLQSIVKGSVILAAVYFDVRRGARRGEPARTRPTVDPADRAVRSSAGKEPREDAEDPVRAAPGRLGIGDAHAEELLHRPAEPPVARGLADPIELGLAHVSPEDQPVPLGVEEELLPEARAGSRSRPGAARA